MDVNPWAVAGMVAVGLLTFYLGFQASRSAITTPDFLLARRAVRSQRNAAAVAGEYLSAASFLGVAGLVLKDGASSLWYPVGFTAGFLAMLMFVAAPLRRSGAYTLPDFAEARLQSSRLRNLCSVFVVLICFLYLVPQLQGAGLALSMVLPVPAWVGPVVVSVLVVANVLGGGMRTATVVQAAQYWIKLFAVAAPTIVLCLVFFASGAPQGQQLDARTTPTFPSNTTVHVDTPVQLSVRQPVRVSAHGTVDGKREDRELVLDPGRHRVRGGATLGFVMGSPVPAVEDAEPVNASWLRLDSGGNGVFEAYSLMFALFVGAIGLPHVLVRFYTNPNGRAARRTVLHVLVLLGLFYLFPTILGGLSRLYVPKLLVTGRTDAAILELPGAMLSGTPGQVLTGVIIAGAFAAFLSTSSGLLVSLAGVLSTEVLPGRVRDFRLAAVFAGLIPLALAILLRPNDISMSVGASFALAASTFAPLLVLGIWWRRLTAAGAAAGILVGGVLVLASMGLTVASQYTGGWAPAFLQQPALLTVPVAFLTVVLVSKATQRGIPPGVNSIFLRLHAPDPLGFTRDRDVVRFGSAGGQESASPATAQAGQATQRRTPGRHRK